MPGLPHLLLHRVNYENPRRKVGFGRAPDRDFAAHAAHLERQLSRVLRSYRQRRLPGGVNPGNILRVRLSKDAAVDEDSWAGAGLHLLSVDENKTLVLFPSQ